MTHRILVLLTFMTILFGIGKGQFYCPPGYSLVNISGCTAPSTTSSMQLFIDYFNNLIGITDQSSTTSGMYTALYSNATNIGVIFYGAGTITLTAPSSSDYQKIYSPSLAFNVNPSTITATQASAAIDTNITDAYIYNPNTFTFTPSGGKICYGLINSTNLTDVTLLGITGACSDGTLPSLSSSCEVCIACPSNCAACSSTTTCTTCNSGYYISSDGSCAVCSSPCATCSNGECASCIFGYYFSSGSCLSCTSPCATCSGSPTNCLSCVASYFLNSSTCTACSRACYRCEGVVCYECSNGHYLSLTNCIACNSPCAECLGSATFCTSCSEGYNLVTPGYICVSISASCSSPCATCSTTNSICTSCLDGYYLTGNSCTPCDSSCLTCSGAGSTSCTSCLNGYYLSGSTCVSCVSPCTFCSSASTCITCVWDYYATLSSGCQPCVSPCFICVSNSTTCTSCNYGRYLSENTCLPCTASNCETCNSAPSVCSSCPSGYYLSSPNCLPCTSPCATCSGASIYNCQSCIGGYHYQPNSPMCLTTCPNNYYANKSNCSLCDSSCSRCFGPTNTSCYACISGYYYQSIIRNTCNTTCLNGSYAIVSNNSCVNCSNTCATCLGGGSSNCTSCKAPYFLLENSPSSCGTTCSNGFWGNATSRTCEPCDASCAICADQSNSFCSACNAGYYLQPAPNSRVCLNSCPLGYWTSNTSQTCDQCDLACANCSGSTNSSCTACKNGYYLQPSPKNNTCFDTCPTTGFYPNSSTNACSSCDASCTRCFGPTSSSCDICNNGYYLQPSPNNNSCFQTCPTAGFYPNNSTNTCSSCDASCTQCFGPTNSSCTACNNGYYLHKNSCITCARGAPSGQVGSGFDFSTCCRVYSNSSGNKCAQCYAGFYLYQGSCVIACPGGTYSNATDYACNKFMTCTSVSDCTADISQPECNGTICVACSNDADCQQWYDQTEESCNTTSGACFLNIDSATQKLASISSTLATSGVIAVTGAAAISAFASAGHSSQSVNTLRITRIASLLRYVNIQFPYQAEVLFESFSSSQATMQKILISVFGSQQFNQSTNDLPTRFTKFGDSSLFLKNAGNLFLICMIVALAIPINRICLYLAIKKRNRVWRTRFLTICKTLEWNSILGWILGAYPDLVLAVSLQMYDLPFSNLNITALSWTSFVACVVIAPVAILFPIFCYYLMRAGKKTRTHQYHEISRYEVLIVDFKENNKQAKSYQILNFLRAQAIGFPLVFWQSSPLAQISFILISFLVINIFHLIKVDYKSRYINFVVLTSELLLYIGVVGLFLHVVCNASGVESNNQKLLNLFGWVIVFALSALMFFNFIISILELLKLILKAIKLIRARYTVSSKKQRSHLRLPGISDVSISSPPPSNISLGLKHGNTSVIHNVMLEESVQDMNINKKIEISTSKHNIREKMTNLPDALQEETIRGLKINNKFDISKDPSKVEIRRKRAKKRNHFDLSEN